MVVGLSGLASPARQSRLARFKTRQSVKRQNHHFLNMLRAGRRRLLAPGRFAGARSAILKKGVYHDKLSHFGKHSAREFVGRQ
jgi:hypothetical protein